MTVPIVERMRAALDAHDLDAFVEFFHEDYVGERSRHPGSAMSSRHDVRRNWEEVIGDVPSGALLEIRGVIIFGVRDGRVAWARMYLEPVEETGRSLGQLVHERPGPLE